MLRTLVLAVLAIALALTSTTTIALAEPADPTQAIWVNGSSGSDDNDGSQESPVATFEKAKELMEASGLGTIYVSGTINLRSSGSAEWDLGGGTLARGAGFKGELVHLNYGSSLTLTNGEGGLSRGWPILVAAGVVVVAVSAVLRRRRSE